MLAIAEKPNNPIGNPRIGERSKEGVVLRERIRKTLSQAVDLQHLAYKVAMTLQDTNLSKEESESKRAHAQAVASIIKAWDISADRVRIVRGKGLPRSLDVSPKQKVKQKPMLFSEQMPE